MQLSKLGEFRLIKGLEKFCETTSRKDVILGIGDDAAAIKTSKGIILITSDTLIEGVHFDLSFTTSYQLGYKILAVNISDIFAMGGKPKYFILNLAIPRTSDTKCVREIYRGIKKLANKFDIAIIGGDTSASKDKLLLSGTLIGETKKIITRAGARPGDGIFVTGTLGDSAMGLRILKKIGKKINFEGQGMKIKGSPLPLTPYTLSLIKQHLMPEPRPLKDISGVTSMIDISDGLLMDLSHICEKSRVGAIIYKDKIPLSKELINAARDLNIDPFRFAFKGGEDYVLLFTASSGVKINAFRIGEIIEQGCFIVDAKGKKTPFKAEGYEHFRRKF